MKKVYQMLMFFLLLGIFNIGVSADAIEFKKVIPHMKAAEAKSFDTIEVSWEVVEGADSYILYYSSGPVIKWKRVKANIHDTSYVHISNKHTPIYTGTTYHYIVCAMKDGVKSSHEKKGIEVKTSLGAAKLKKVNSINYNKLEISWEKVPGADGYLIYRKENGKWIKIGTAAASSSSFVQISTKKHPIEIGIAYTYTVKAYRKTVNGTVYSTYSKTGISGKSEYVSGWYEENGSTYYYANKKKVTGWKKISGKMYYFTSSGKLQKDKIVGTAADGYWYVDTTGVRVTDTIIVKAVKLITTITEPGWSADKKLKTCYDYFVRSCSYERAYDAVAISKMPSYADYMLTNKCGNCYRGAAALAYCAKVLGFETRVTVGGVSSRTYGSLSVHGWMEIKVNGKWYMSDISMQRPRLNVNLYRILQEDYPFRLRVDDHYGLTAQNGKISWN